MSMVTRLTSLFKPRAEPSPGPKADTPERRESYIVEPEMRLERSNPKGQIAELWTDIIQRRIPVAWPNSLRNLCIETIEAMPGLSFASANDRAKTWGMVGSLYFKTTHPDWLGGFEGTEPCPVAERCYREANQADPDPWWHDWIARFSGSEADGPDTAAPEQEPGRPDP